MTLHCAIIEGNMLMLLPRQGTSNAVSIIGFFHSVMGLGEDARTLAEAVLRIGLRPELVDISPFGLQPNLDLARYRPFETASPRADTVVFCLPPGEMRRAYDMLELDVDFVQRRRIGYWPWELSVLPAAFEQAFNLVDEIWASSTFLFDLYSRCGRLPVRYVPLSVMVEHPTLTPDLASLIDGRFTVLTVFDFHSRMARKNPIGAVAAFRQAFPIGTEPVQLIIKTINGERRPDDLARLLAVTFEDERIAVVDGAISRAALCGLVAASDVYLSLHRAEGFGRPVAEAMLLGTPVVATRWSGTADFLDDETGYPVSFGLRPVQPEEYIHAVGLWAEPNLDEAASHLRALFQGPVRRDQICAAARRRITALCGSDSVDTAIRTALSAVAPRSR